MNDQAHSASSRRIRTALATTAVTAVALFAFAGCNRAETASPTTAATAPRPALTVEVFTVAPQAVELTRELPGRTAASQVAEVRARINGIVQKRLFTEGTDVKAGQVLFAIDAAPYEAVLASAKANLARAEANLTSAEVQANRLSGLVSTHAISQQTFDDAVARHLAAKADLQAALAAVRSAEINLGYTQVTAPISGRIGRAEVTVGAYVQQATASLLAVIQQLDPLYVDLSQSADEVLQLQDALASGRLHGTGTGDVALTVLRDDGTAHPQTGSLQFSDVSVNPSTGTVNLRGLVPNPDTRLLPGMFVHARFAEGTDPSAILVPHSLVSRNARGEATVMLVGADNTVELRVIQTARTVGNQWLVRSGLQSGDRIISSQRQKIAPGAPVQVTAATAASATAE